MDTSIREPLRKGGNPLMCKRANGHSSSHSNAATKTMSTQSSSTNNSFSNEVQPKREKWTSFHCVDRNKEGSKQTLPAPKFEAFIMTGDLIINLANTKSSDAFGALNSSRNFRFNSTPNVLTSGDDRSCNSMPSSPVGDTNDCNDVCSKQFVDNNNCNEGKEHKETQTYPKRQMSMPFVRFCKSEDHLLTSENITVVDIDCMGECESNSLNTLLNDDEGKLSSSASPDNDNDHEFNDDDEELLTTTRSYSLSSDNDTCNDSTKSTSTSTQDATLSSANVSPTKTMTTATNTQAEQTESSMSENYSVVSSLSGAGQTKAQHNRHNPSLKKHNQQTLSLSSSTEDSTTPSTSPDDHLLKVANFEDDGGSSTVEDVSYLELKEDENMKLTPVHTKSPAPPPPKNPYNCKNFPAQHSISSSDEESSDVESLHSFHYSPPKGIDTPSATRLAKRLYHLEGFKKSDVSRHLSKANEFSRVVAEEYLRFFEFTGDSLDLALRKFLSRFCLIGETQERERVLVHFSKRYLDCNPGSFKSNDAVHTLTCALMLLNTDLHGENIGRKMTCGEFIENLSDLNEGENFPRETLRHLFQAIKQLPLEWATDEEENLTQTDASRTGNSSAVNNLNQAINMIGHNPFLEVPNPNSATEYKKGYIMRKSCFDCSGKRTPIGKRGWKMFYATLRDLVLFLHKDEQGFRKNQLYESLNNSIRVHHALASNASDYTKKQFVFRLETAENAEFLFQTSDVRELQAWVDTINFVAASLSAPPMPGAVGSNAKKFQRPLLPVSHTKFNLRDQLADHENRIFKLQIEIEEHSSKAPEKGSSKRVMNEFAEKENFLQHELKRYKTYVSVLKSKLSQYCTTGNSTNSVTISAAPQPLLSVAIGEESSDDSSDTPIIIPVKRSYSTDR